MAGLLAGRNAILRKRAGECKEGGPLRIGKIFALMRFETRSPARSSGGYSQSHVPTPLIPAPARECAQIIFWPLCGWAGTHNDLSTITNLSRKNARLWIPAFAGMSGWKDFRVMP
jgi:hypothetical protein